MSIRKVFVAAVLALAPLAVAAAPAGALAVGQTVCYSADGSPIVNPSTRMITTPA